MIPRIVIAAPASGAGKTTIATGLVAALARRGLRPAAFKVGPDFIDPTYHRLASGRPGRNLDAFMSGEELIAPLFRHGADGADIAVIEGVMGLFDGRGGSDDFASTAHVARLLEAPVVLVVDARAMAGSVAALVSGFASFDPHLRVAGVFLNRVGSEAHEAMLREALARLGVPVIGALARDEALAAPERHLGLVPAAERGETARRTVAAWGERVGAACDLEAVVRLARTAGPLSGERWRPREAAAGAGAESASDPVAIAVAAGPAFSFRYEENLELLHAAGAELLEFDPLADELPEGAEALLLSGGFPEAFAGELSEAHALCEAVRGLADAGHPVVAECGGMLFLCRELDGRPMCGVIDASARMTDRLTLGYREAESMSDSVVARSGWRLRGHEFHYSTVEPPAGAAPAWRLESRGQSRAEGFVRSAVHAGYLHTHWAASPEVAARIVASARSDRHALVGGVLCAELDKGAEIRAEREPQCSVSAGGARVVFVGAGPGAADLITLRGARAIAAADLVLWARSLVMKELVLEHAREDAELIDSARLTLEDQREVYERAADEGLTVARIHSGDPSIYSAVGEQIRILEETGLPYEIVPGVGSLSAAAAALGQELTVPERAQSLILTRREGRAPMPPGERVEAFARHGTTMALFLSIGRAAELEAELLAGGYPAEAPCAVVYRASWPDQRVLRCALGELAARVREAGIERQALVLVGPGLGAAGTRSHLYDPEHGHRFREAVG